MQQGGSGTEIAIPLPVGKWIDLFEWEDKMLSIKTHNILDYVTGAILLFVPAIFGFSEIDAARNIFIFAGISLIGYSLLTKYQYSLWKVIPLGVHMSLDVLLGVV